MNLAKNPKSLIHSINFATPGLASPSNFQSHPERVAQKQFELDLVYDAEKLNETNLVSSNNATSRELSQKRPVSKSQLLVNQTSLDPHLGPLKSPEFPKKQADRKDSRRQIETIPFDHSPGLYKTQHSISQIRTPKSPCLNSKTVKHIRDNSSRAQPKSIKKIIKRAKSRPVSRGSGRGQERASVNIGSKVLPQKETYKKQHRSFQKKKKSQLDFLSRNRKRALSSKEILFGSGLAQNINLKNLPGVGELYRPQRTGDQVELIYVIRRPAPKVGLGVRGNRKSNATARPALLSEKQVLREARPNLPARKKHNRKKKKFLSNDMSKMYNFDSVASKKVNSQKKQIQETIPYVLSKEDLLKIKKFQNRETKSNLKEVSSNPRVRPASKGQSIYGGQNISAHQSELAFQPMNPTKQASGPGPIFLIKNPSNNPSFISVQPNIYGHSHQLVQNVNGETFLLPVGGKAPSREGRPLRNSNTSGYSKGRYSSEQRPGARNGGSQQGSLSNFTVFGSSQNLDLLQGQGTFQRSSHHSSSIGDPLRSDFLLSRTTSIKAEPDLQEKHASRQSGSDFWFYNGHPSNAPPPEGQQTPPKPELAPGTHNLHHPRQSVTLQEPAKPQILIYSHNPSVQLGEKSPPLPRPKLPQTSGAKSQVSGKSLKKSKKRRRALQTTHFEPKGRQSPVLRRSKRSSQKEKSVESSKSRFKKLEKKLEDMTVEDLKHIFEILDCKKQGCISKDNFKFTDLPLKTINAMEPFIKEMLVREGTVDFNQYINLIQTMVQKRD